MINVRLFRQRNDRVHLINVNLNYTNQRINSTEAVTKYRTSEISILVPILII